MNDTTKSNFEFSPFTSDSTLQSTFHYEPRKIAVKILRDHLTSDTDLQKIEEKIGEYLNDGWSIIHQSTAGYAAYSTTLITVLQRYSDWNNFLNYTYDGRTVFKNNEM